MKKKIIWTIVVVVLVVAGVVLIQFRKNKENKLPAAQVYATVVSAINPEYGKTQLTLPYIALVQNDKDVKLTTKVSGRVEYIKSSGSKVSAGEVIIKLDNTDIQGNINSLEAQIKGIKTVLENLNSTHKRTLELLAVKGASIEQSQKEESQMANLEAQLESLKQKRNEASNMLGYAEIKSPANGTLSKTTVNLGDVVMPGQPVGAINANSGAYLLVRVPDDLKVVGVKMKGQFYEALSLNSSFNGLAEYKVYPGNISLTTGSREQIEVVVFDGEAIKLPHDAILNRDGKSYVLVIDGDKASPQEVKIIQSGEDGVVIAGQELVNNQIVTAKQDILLKLAGGVSLTIKN